MFWTEVFPGADSGVLGNAVLSLGEHTLNLRAGVAERSLEVVLLVDEVRVNVATINCRNS